ncbi:MAG: flagellar biosynthesis anti-sigma factor FlgM [Phycisphaerae bacterium]|nr:flagellar biosynthesis anti-sigma factor FlgM [Phycisphaerae bacterium]
MPSFDSKNRFEERNQQFDSAGENLVAEQDLLMEQILENINATPVGQVLKKIASLPEVRKEKVLDVRERISKGRYKLNERLDVALDKVLEDLII